MMKRSLNVGIVGCGLIGQKRAAALGGHRLVAAADADASRARALAAGHSSAKVLADWRALVADPGVDCVVVATTPDCLAPITLAAIEAGKHVLVEKPAARSPEELIPLIAAAKRAGVRVQVGFNHRYHPALQKARELFDTGTLGEPMFVRGRYGHGGRIGYDKEWRADPRISGGGELLDQGAHLIDLSRWFLGDFVKADGYIHTYFWDMPVEDNGFLLLKTAAGQAAWLHASWTEWKNMFSFEIYTKHAKLDISGLGGSYGLERLTYHKMSPKLGPPETTTWEYPGEDASWRLEFEAFARAIEDGREPIAGLEDAKAALDIIAGVYAAQEPAAGRRS
jgi:predicted dehydrogenase